MSEAQGTDRDPALADSVLAEFSDLVAEFDGASAWETTVAAFGDYLPEGFGLDPWAEIAARIERCVADGRPASFIRVGDGEGNLLGLELNEHPELTDHCVRAASLVHFGAAEALVRAAPQVLPAFQTALHNSDLIGFPGPFGGGILLDRPAAEMYVRPIQGLACVHRYLTRFADSLELGSKTGAPAGFHRGLLPHYEALVSGRRIGIVTAHPELADGLRVRMGAEAVDLRLVPRQAAITGAPRAETGHWPGRFRELVGELQTIEPGTLWFVAAGLLGKVYSDVIRTAGGIAVDIGHTADVWAGIRSRASIRPSALATWRIVPPRAT
jgi:hypothetical protein